MCSSDSQCSSGKCFNATCLAESQTKPTCNKTAEFLMFSETDYSTAIIPTVNRCLDSVCAKQSECSTCFCKEDSSTCQKSDDVNHPMFPNCPSDVEPAGDKTLLIVLSVIGGILVICLAVGSYLLWKKKRDERILADLRANASDRNSMAEGATTKGGKNNINSIITKD